MLHRSQGPILPYISVLLLSLFLGGCQAPVAKITGPSGKFMISMASRDGKLTQTLEDGYFDFLSDTTLATNIFGAPEVYPMVLSEDGFVHKMSPEISYSMFRYGKDSILLQASIRDTPFEFLLVRDTVAFTSVDSLGIVK